MFSLLFKRLDGWYVNMEIAFTTDKPSAFRKHPPLIESSKLPYCFFRDISKLNFIHVSMTYRTNWRRRLEKHQLHPLSWLRACFTGIYPKKPLLRFSSPRPRLRKRACKPWRFINLSRLLRLHAFLSSKDLFQCLNLMAISEIQDHQARNNPIRR